MLELHFHFSESYADWVQVFLSALSLIVSSIGIWFVYQAFRQGNRNIEMQINASRTASRSRLSIEPTDHYPQQEHDDDYLVICHFAVKANEKDALEIIFVPKNTDKVKFCDARGALINELQCHRLVAGNSFSFYVNGRSKRQPITGETVEMDIEYVDDLGYRYSQKIRSRVGENVALQRIQYLE